MLRNMISSGLVLVALIALLLLGLMIFQNKLLYFPTKASIDSYVPANMQAWPSTTDAIDGQQVPPILGLFAPPAANASKGTIVVFHGNAGHAAHRSYYAQMFAPLGFRTVLAEYPGYGPRPGTPDEKSIVSDAVRIVEHAHKLYGDPIWIVGESLGAGVAASVLSSDKPNEAPNIVSGVVLITPWNRLVDVAAHHYPYLPVRWLLRSEYNSTASLASFGGPVMIVVAENDRIVPAHLGQDLYASIDEPKSLILLEGAGHNDWASYTSDDFWPEIMQWLCEAASC